MQVRPPNEQIIKPTTTFFPFIAYLLLFYSLWTGWVYLIYPHMEQMGDTTLAYTIINIAFRLLLWILPVFLYLRYIDRVNPFEYLKLKQYWKRGVIVTANRKRGLLEREKKSNIKRKDLTRSPSKKTRRAQIVSISKNSHDEQPSTYVVQDRSNKEEMIRLQIQDEMATTSMGGVLPEQSDPTQLKSVLDIGCGTGGWLIQVARTYPTISRLVGIDISQKMLAYARTQAVSSPESQRVEYQTMDVLRKLNFADVSFDLVNQRFAMTYLRTWDWANVLSEHQRITRPGGIIRLTECNIPESNSSALNHCNDLLIEALTQAGHFSSAERDNVIDGLAARLHQAGIRNIQTRLYTTHYRADTPQGQIFIEDGKHILRTFLPFLRKWTRIPEGYDTLCQQALHDMQQPDFTGTWKIFTAWGTTIIPNTWSTPTIS